MDVGAILVGKYRVDRVLGQGGMGLVVQATHLQLGQPVAVTFLLPEVLGNREVVQRFLRDASGIDASDMTSASSGPSATAAAAARPSTSAPPPRGPPARHKGPVSARVTMMRSRALVLIVAAACSRHSAPPPSTSATHGAELRPTTAPSPPASPHTYAITSDDVPDYVTNIVLDVPAGWAEQAAGDKSYRDVFEPEPGGVERLLVVDGHHAVVRLAVLEYPHGRASLDISAMDFWLGADHQPGVAISQRPDGRYTITIHHDDGSLHYVLYVPEPFAAHPFDDNGPGHLAVCEARLDASAVGRLAEVEHACDGMRVSGQYPSVAGPQGFVVRPKKVKELVPDDPADPASKTR